MDEKRNCLDKFLWGDDPEQFNRIHTPAKCCSSRGIKWLRRVNFVLLLVLSLITLVVFHVYKAFMFLTCWGVFISAAAHFLVLFANRSHDRFVANQNNGNLNEETREVAEAIQPRPSAWKWASIFV